MRLFLAFTFAGVASAAAASVIVACSDETTSSSTNVVDASTDGRSRVDDAGGGEGEEDGGADATTDATKDAKAARDANGPGEAGTECIFNHDCQLALRCSACDAGYCFCEPGARGTGRNGVDTCTSGDQCTSALCVEGPGTSGVHYCSDECASNGDCTGMLPKCVSIPSFAAFCARDGG